jgi:hypothetical protein
MNAGNQYMCLPANINQNTVNHEHTKPKRSGFRDAVRTNPVAVVVVKIVVGFPPIINLVGNLAQRAHNLFSRRYLTITAVKFEFKLELGH